MSFTEWSNAKKKKEEESSKSPSVTKPTTSSGNSGMSFTEWSNTKTTGSAITGYNDKDAVSGWQKFQADQKKKREKEEEKSWFEKAIAMFAQTSDSTLPGANITNVISAYRNDTSYREPTHDWSEQQRKDFGYLYSQSPEQAWNYAEKVNNGIARKVTESQKTAINKSATDGFWKGAAHTAGAIATAPLGLADYLDNMAEYTARGKITEKAGVTPYDYSQTVTGSIANKLNGVDMFGKAHNVLPENIPIIGGKGWGDVYGLGTSIVQSSLAGYTGGQFGTLVQFFGSAAASGVKEAKRRGASDEQALKMGTLSGAAEGLAEMVGVDNLLNIGSSATMRQLMTNLAKQGAAEGLEEGLTTLMNNFADQIVMKDKSNFNTMVRQLMENGMSEQEAKKKAWLSMANDLAFDMVAGFASGAIHAGPQTAYETYQTGREMRTTYGSSQQELVEQGLESAEGSLSHELATKFKEKLDAGHDLSGMELQQLVQANEQQFYAEDMENIQKAAGNRLAELGETGNVQAISEALAKQAAGQKLTRAERQIIANSQYGQRVANEMKPENISSGDYASNWAGQIGTNRINDQAYNEALMTLAQEAATPKVAQTNPAQQAQENRAIYGKVDTQKENGTQSHYEASESGETILQSTGEVVSIYGIATIKNGQMTFKLEDGRTVNAKDMSYGSQSEALVYEAVAKLDGIIDTETANKLSKHLLKLGDVSSDMYVNGIEQAYTYGYYGYGRDAMLGNNTLSATLTEKQRNVAYGLGEQYRAARTAADQALVRKTRTNKKSPAAGKVHFDGDRSTLTERQSASLSAMETVAEALGVQIYVFESQVDENGKHIGANGWYDPKDSSIHIDLHAGATGEGTMLFTTAHELTHHIRKWSPAKFKTLADFLMQEYGQKDVNVDSLVRAQIAKAKRGGRTISYDTAYEEVIADSMESMLSDGKVVEKLAKLKQVDKSLWQKIKDFISDLVSKIRKVYEGMSPDSAEGRFVAEMVDSIEKLQELFTEALVDASENYQASLTPGVEGTIVNQNGDPVAHATSDGTIQLSVRTYEEEGREAFRKYLQKCVSSKKLTKAEMQEMLDGIEEIYGICKEFKDKYAPFSSWSDAAVVRDTHGKPVFSVVTPNGDYKMNLDFSLVCKKRRTLDAVFNEMSRRGIIDDFELGQKSVVKINEIIRKYDLETACALCFVDAKRFRQASMADSFTRLYNELVESLVPEDQRGSIDHFNFSGYATIRKVEDGIHKWDASKLDFSHINHVLKTYGDGTVEYKAAKYIKTHAEGRKLLLRGDFMSSQGFDAVKTQNPDVLKLYNSKKGTGGPKAAFGDVQYLNEIIQKARWWTPAKAYEVGGVRIQSFSDYVPRMVFDYVQMIYDLAATKLPAHAYTKEALFVKQFGLTGVKINMSLIPAIAEGGIAPGLDANGNYVWAGESFDFETAKQIQNAPGYTENCGTICVGVSDRHIRKLLSDPDIRMVIPYHKSGLNPIVAHMNKIAEFTDYTNKQNTTVKETGSKAEKHFDFNAALHKMGKNADPRAVIQQYFDWCDSNGYDPKFSDFRDHPNYYKLIEDFTLYDMNGQYVPQREVRAVFPKETDAFGSMKDLIKEGLEEDAIVEGKRDSRLSKIVDEIQKTLPKTEAEIEETQVEQADRDLEALKLSDRDNAPTFYSHMARVVDGVKQAKLGAASVVSMLRGKGVKAEEIKWSGIEEWLAGKKSVTKAELQEFIAGSMLQIGEQTSGTSSFVDEDGNAYTETEFRNRAYEIADEQGIDRDRVKFILDGNEMYAYVGNVFSGEILSATGINGARWSEYKLDGGENYREIVFTLPNSTYSNQMMRIHWGEDAEGVLAHARVQDFNVNGKKMLFIEEIQSDYHNEGHQSGYADSKLEAKLDKLKAIADEKFFALEDYSTETTGMAGEWEAMERTVKGSRLLLEYTEAQDAYDKAMNEAVKTIPDAPFRDTYHEFVLKRLIREAAEKGYDSIGWTTAQIQSDRWSEEFAEGYRIEYDQDIPKFLNKYGKKWGTRVGKTVLDNGTEVWSMAITDSMKDSVLTEGQPLYSDRDSRTYAEIEEERQALRQREMMLEERKRKAVNDPELLQAMDAYSGLFTEMRELFSKKRNGTATQAELDRIEEIKRLREESMKRVTDLQESLGLNAIAQEETEIRETKEALRIASDAAWARDGAEKESKAIEKAGVSAPEYFRKKALKAFKTTTNFNEAGYLLPDGKLLNFSGGERNHRYRDHREIGEIYEATQGTAALNRFMSDGNIRIMAESPGVDITSGIEPTNEQYAALRKFVNSHGVKERKFFVDFSDSDGHRAGNYSYEGRVNADRVINDIKHYYATGEIREQSSVAQFLWSDRDTESVSNRSLLANAFEGVAQNDIERQKIQEYKGKIDLINAEERKLADLNQKIKDLSFAKGPKDTKAIRDLQFEAKQTANRISTYDKQLLRLEASKPLQDVLTREKNLAYKRAEQKGKEALAAYREKSAKTQKELITRYQDARKRGIESREKTAMRHKIKDVVNELNQYLLNGNKDKRVMMGLKKAVAEALDAVNMDTVGAEERIAKLEAELLKAKTPEAIQEISRKIDHIRAMGDKMSSRLKALKDAYREIAESDDPLIANAHDDVIEAKLESVIEKVGNTPLRDMNVSQLEEVYDMYRMVLTTIRNSNKAFKAAKNESIAILGNRVMEEIDKVGGKRKYNLAAVEAIKKFGWNNLKPVYAFEHIGSDTFTEVFNNVRAGEDVWAVDVTEAREFYLDKARKYKYNSWNFDKRYTFTSSSGMNFSLNLEQIMSLYAYSKRDQAADHLKRGGIVIDESTEVTMKTKLGFKAKFNPTEATAYNISEETLAEIIGKLTEDQKQYVDEMQEYLSTVMGAKGNEVSLELYGIKLFKEKFYFPLKSASQFMAKAKEQQQGEVKIKNSGFSKETVKKASNPIVLTPFMNVWSNHVNEMSMYHAFVLPMEDFYRVWSYRTPTSDTMATESVEMFLQNAYGKGATKYIDQLLKDLNGGARTDSTTGVINKMMGLFKKGAVFASLSVVVQQPSAIARAAAIVDTKYFIGPKVDHKRHEALWKEVKKYAPVAIIKEMGYFDTNMGKSTQDFILGKEYSGFKEKMKALVTDSDFRDEALSKAPALADELAWCSIWEAVKRETKAKYPGLDVKGEPFLKLAGSRFTEVVTKTQVYDSVLARSANMRSKDTGMKMATAFMAEPTTSINMIADALLQGKRGNKKYARAAIGAVIASQILNSILVSFVYAGRDDDEDETYWEKYIGTLSGEIIDSLNPATYIPFIKDIVSIVQGYDVERSDMAVISDLWNAYQKLGNDKVSPYRKVEGFAGSIAQIFGLPLKNIMRDVRGIYQTINSFMSGPKTTKAGIGYAVKSTMPKWMGGGDVSDQTQLYEAMVSGDKAQISRVKSRFKDQSAIQSAIRMALRENDPRIREAAIAWNANDLDEYMRIAKAVIAEKHFSQDDVVMAIRAEASKLAPDSGETTSTAKSKGLFTAEKFAEAISQNDQAMAYSIMTDIVQTNQRNGATASDAKKSFGSSASSACKKLFLDGGMTVTQAENALVDYCGVEREAAQKRVGEWKFEYDYGYSYDDRVEAYKKGVISAYEMKPILMEVGGRTSQEADNDIRAYEWMKNNPSYDISVSDVLAYTKTIEDAGVSVEEAGIDPDMFVEYRVLRSKCKGVDEDNDGTADRNSVKNEVLEIINDMPITSYQKDVLYYLNGWAKSNLRKAPWH